MSKPMKSILKLERQKSLTELVGEELRKWIVEGDLELGESVSEARLADQLGVSRTPVREALHQLDLEGLVTTQPQRGTYVFTLDRRDLANICDVRITLEKLALKLSMDNDQSGLASTLEGVTREMAEARRAGDDRQYLRLDTRFHGTLFKHTGNPFLSDAYQTIASKIAALRYRLGAHPEHMEKSFKEHVAIATAVATGDAVGAEATLLNHIGDKAGSFWHTGEGKILTEQEPTGIESDTD